MNEEEITVVKHGQKFCTTCRTLKPLSDFYPSKNHRFGVHHQCKDCRVIYLRQYRKKNREKIVDYQHRYHKKNREKHLDNQRQRRKKNRKKVLDDMGGKCVYCGCNLFEALQINHKHGGGNQDPAGSGFLIINAILQGRRTTDDLEVVCPPCNTKHKCVELDGLPDGWTITWKDPQ